MNALVASVIRTYTPIIVGQVAAWLIMIHFPVKEDLTVLLTAVVGAALSFAYYTLVRVLEQQWPWVGALLGLTASPDSYSKGDPAATTSPAARAPADLPAVAEATLSLNAATSFAATQAKIDALPVVVPEQAEYVPLDKPVVDPLPPEAPAPIV